MNKEHLTKIWTWASAACLLFVAASVISIQGGSEFLGKLFGDRLGNVSDNRPAVGYFAAAIGGALFFAASSALALHSKRHGGAWHERVPVVWLEGLNTAAWDGKIFQAAILILFLVMPGFGIIACIVTAESGDICELDTRHFYKSSDTTLLNPPTSLTGGQMRLRRGGAGEEPCTDGIEIFPRFGTPALVYGIPVLSGCMALVALGLTFFPRPGSAPITGSARDDSARSEP